MFIKGPQQEQGARRGPSFVLPVACVAMAVMALGPARTQAQGPVEIAERAAAAVVTLQTFKGSGERVGQGSGYFLADGRIVTNIHVVEGAERVDVFGAQERFLGSVPHAEAVSSTVDLAILPRLGVLPGFLELVDALPRIGEPVVVIGAPLGLSHTVSSGIVSAIRIVEGVTLIQITAPISRGSSGGPVLNASGEVIGVAVSSLEAGQSLNFAVPSRDVRALASSPIAAVPFPGTGSTTAPSGVPRPGGPPSLRDIRVGEWAERNLGLQDDLFPEGGRYHVYDFRGAVGALVTISLFSRDFDPRLRFSSEEPPWRAPTAQAENQRSVVTARLPHSGTYRVEVSSRGPDEMGRYRLAVTRGVGSETTIGWVRYASTPDGKVHYFHPATVRELSPGLLEVWDRVDFPGVQPGSRRGEGFDSSTTEVRVDCRSGRSALLSHTDHREGRPVRFDEVRETVWVPRSPASTGGVLIRLVCGL